MSDIQHVHEGKYVVGHVVVPYTVSHNVQETGLVMEIGIDEDYDNAFADIIVTVDKDGEIHLRGGNKSGDRFHQTLGNVITGRTGTLRGSASMGES